MVRTSMGRCSTSTFATGVATRLPINLIQLASPTSSPLDTIRQLFPLPMPVRLDAKSQSIELSSSRCLIDFESTQVCMSDAQVALPLRCQDSIDVSSRFCKWDRTRGQR